MRKAAPETPRSNIRATGIKTPRPRGNAKRSPDGRGSPTTIDPAVDAQRRLRLKKRKEAMRVRVGENYAACVDAALRLKAREGDWGSWSTIKKGIPVVDGLNTINRIKVRREMRQLATFAMWFFSYVMIVLYARALYTDTIYKQTEAILAAVYGSPAEPQKEFSYTDVDPSGNPTCTSEWRPTGGVDDGLLVRSAECWPQIITKTSPLLHMTGGGDSGSSDGVVSLSIAGGAEDWPHVSSGTNMLDLVDIGSFGELWYILTEQLPGALYADSWYNGDTIDPTQRGNMVGGTHMLRVVGKVRLRQNRVQSTECYECMGRTVDGDRVRGGPAPFKSQCGAALKCYGAYSVATEDRDFVAHSQRPKTGANPGGIEISGEGWGEYSTTNVSASVYIAEKAARAKWKDRINAEFRSAFVWNPDVTKLEGSPGMGNNDVPLGAFDYGEGGYVVHGNNTDLEVLLKALLQAGWVDKATRAISVDFNLYSPETLFVSVVRLRFEFLHSGLVVNDVTIRSVLLAMYDFEARPLTTTVRLLCEIVFFTMLVVYWSNVARQVCLSDQVWRPFTEFPFIVELMIQLFISAWAVMWFRLVANDDRLTFDANEAEFRQYWNLASLSDQIWIFSVFVALLGSVKIFMLLAVSPRMYRINLTLLRASAELLVFGLTFVIIIVGFGIGNMLIYGHAIAGYRNGWSAFMSTTLQVLGEFDLDEYVDAAGDAAIANFFLFQGVMNFVQMNLFIAIVCGYFDNVIEDERVAYEWRSREAAGFLAPFYDAFMKVVYWLWKKAQDSRDTIDAICRRLRDIPDANDEEDADLHAMGLQFRRMHEVAEKRAVYDRCVAYAIDRCEMSGVDIFKYFNQAIMEATDEGRNTYMTLDELCALLAGADMVAETPSGKIMYYIWCSRVEHCPAEQRFLKDACWLLWCKGCRGKCRRPGGFSADKEGIDAADQAEMVFSTMGGGMVTAEDLELAGCTAQPLNDEARAKQSELDAASTFVDGPAPETVEEMDQDTDSLAAEEEDMVSKSFSIACDLVSDPLLISPKYRPMEAAKAKTHVGDGLFDFVVEDVDSDDEHVAKKSTSTPRRRSITVGDDGVETLMDPIAEDEEQGHLSVDFTVFFLGQVPMFRIVTRTWDQTQLYEGTFRHDFVLVKQKDWSDGTMTMIILVVQQHVKKKAVHGHEGYNSTVYVRLNVRPEDAEAGALMVKTLKRLDGYMCADAARASAVVSMIAEGRTFVGRCKCSHKLCLARQLCNAYLDVNQIMMQKAATNGDQMSKTRVETLPSLERLATFHVEMLGPFGVKMRRVLVVDCPGASITVFDTDGTLHFFDRFSLSSLKQIDNSILHNLHLCTLHIEEPTLTIPSQREIGMRHLCMQCIFESAEAKRAFINLVNTTKDERNEKQATESFAGWVESAMRFSKHMVNQMRRYDHDRHISSIGHSERMAHLYELEAILDATARGMGLQFEHRSAAAAAAIEDGMEYAENLKEKRRVERKARHADMGRDVSSESFEDSNDEARVDAQHASDSQHNSDGESMDEVDVAKKQPESTLSESSEEHGKKEHSSSEDSDFSDGYGEQWASRAAADASVARHARDSQAAVDAAAAVTAAAAAAAAVVEADRAKLARVATVDPLLHTVQDRLPPPPPLVAELSMETDISMDESSDPEEAARAERHVQEGNVPTDVSASESESLDASAELSAEESEWSG